MDYHCWKLQKIWTMNRLNICPAYVVGINQELKDHWGWALSAYEWYPPIIDEDTHKTLIRIKSEKNTQKSTDRKADIFNLGVPILCPKCGSKMYRRHDSSRKCQDWWLCQNNNCKNIISISDNDLIYGITECLNTVINKPDIIKTVTDVDKEPS